MSNEYSVQVRQSDGHVPGLDHESRTVAVTIMKNRKWFYQNSNTWHNTDRDAIGKLEPILDTVLGDIGLDASGKGEAGPITCGEMVAFEIGMTGAAINLHKLAIMEGEQKGEDMSKAKAALRAILA